MRKDTHLKQQQQQRNGLLRWWWAWVKWATARAADHLSRGERPPPSPPHRVVYSTRWGLSALASYTSSKQMMDGQRQLTITVSLSLSISRIIPPPPPPPLSHLYCCVCIFLVVLKRRRRRRRRRCIT